MEKKEREKIENEVKLSFKSKQFNSDWINVEIDPNGIVFCEFIGKILADKKLSSSKIRSVFGELKRLQGVNDFIKIKSKFLLLSPKVAYAYGRASKLDEVYSLYMFRLFFDECYKYVKDDKTFINFCNLFEAVLAYHKAYGGQD